MTFVTASKLEVRHCVIPMSVVWSRNMLMLLIVKNFSILINSDCWLKFVYHKKECLLNIVFYFVICLLGDILQSYCILNSVCTSCSLPYLGLLVSCNSCAHNYTGTQCEHTLSNYANCSIFRDKSTCNVLNSMPNCAFWKRRGEARAQPCWRVCFWHCWGGLTSVEVDVTVQTGIMGRKFKISQAF